MNVETKLKQLGIIIPEPAQPVAAYVPGIRTGDLVFVSGQLPVKEGQLLYTGRVGEELTIEEGQAAARLSVINCLAVLKSFIAEWDSLLQIVKITGFVQNADNFFEQAKVINGASELLGQVFGERGKHARAAVGASALPLNAACEIEMIAQIK